jgi:hypothetical protein
VTALLGTIPEELITDRYLRLSFLMEGQEASDVDPPVIPAGKLPETDWMSFHALPLPLAA